MITRWWSLVYLVLAAQSCFSLSQLRYNSPFQDALPGDEADSGPEDLFLEELVRNMKWNAANRDELEYHQQPVNHRPQQQHIQKHPTVDDVFELLHDADDFVRDVDAVIEDDGRIPHKFNPEKISISRNGNSRSGNFAFRPNQPEFYSDRSPALAEVNPVIASEPIELPDVSSVPSLSNNERRRAGQKEDIFDETMQSPTRDKQLKPIGNEKFRPNVPASPTTYIEPEKEIDAINLRSAREPIAHAMISEPKAERTNDSFVNIYMTALVAGCTASAVAALLALGVCFYRWQRQAKAAQEVEYPAYGVTGPGPCQSGKSSLKSSPTSSTPGTIGSWSLTKSPKAAAQTGDKKLAHSAHMFHFQHQKQQVIALENNAGCDRTGSNSGGESDEDNEEGDYTVYECPGLAPTGEMEVKNPLFLDDPTPASPALKRPSE